MPALLILGAIAALAPVPGAFGDQQRAYPAMRHEGAAYAVATDAKGRIVNCLPLDPTADAAKVRAACAAITAKGVPASIAPATASGTADDWFPSAEYPADAIPRRSSGSVTVVYEVDERGAAVNCIVQRSSGVAMFDLAACRAMLKRARFAPASYQGKPVHAAAIATFAYDSQ